MPNRLGMELPNKLPCNKETTREVKLPSLWTRILPKKAIELHLSPLRFLINIRRWNIFKCPRVRTRRIHHVPLLIHKLCDFLHEPTIVDSIQKTESLVPEHSLDVLKGCKKCCTSPLGCPSGSSLTRSSFANEEPQRLGTISSFPWYA